jgi:hypothetical protein
MEEVATLSMQEDLIENLLVRFEAWYMFAIFGFKGVESVQIHETWLKRLWLLSPAWDSAPNTLSLKCLPNKLEGASNERERNRRQSKWMRGVMSKAYRNHLW